MYNTAFFVFCLVILCLPTGRLFAQNYGLDTIRDVRQSDNQSERIAKADTISAWNPTTSLFFEILGKGWYSVNVDFRKKVTGSVSLCLQVAEEVWPGVTCYRFLGKTHRIETGGGAGLIIGWDGDFEGMTVYGVIGYRYQKKKGLIFRAGLTPLLGIPFKESGDFAFIPFPGVSLGYSF